MVTHTAPFVYDWNEDGHADIIVGNASGNVQILYGPNYVDHEDVSARLT